MQDRIDVHCFTGDGTKCQLVSRWSIEIALRWERIVGQPDLQGHILGAHAANTWKQDGLSALPMKGIKEHQCMIMKADDVQGRLLRFSIDCWTRLCIIRSQLPIWDVFSTQCQCLSSRLHNFRFELESDPHWTRRTHNGSIQILEWQGLVALSKDLQGAQKFKVRYGELLAEDDTKTLTLAKQYGFGIVEETKSLKKGGHILKCPK